MVDAKTHPLAGSQPAAVSDVGVSLLTLGAAILRSRRKIAGMTVVFATLGLLSGLLSPRMYTSTATIIPQGSDGGQSGGLAAAASQFGIRIPAGGGTGSAWGAPVYVNLFRSRTLLQLIVLDSITITEEGGKRKAILDVLEARGSTGALRLNDGVNKLLDLVSAVEDKPIGSVRLTVTSRQASVSHGVALRLIEAVNRFNLETRKSQAAAERRFVEARALEAETALRDAEEKLSASMERNRIVAQSPQLSLERDRLVRAVNLRQQVTMSLLQSRDEARIREVRDTPVITLLEEPQLPAVGEPRKSVQKAVIGAFAGAFLGALFAFLSLRISVARKEQNEETRVFFDLLGETVMSARRRFKRQ